MLPFNVEYWALYNTIIVVVVVVMVVAVSETLKNSELQQPGSKCGELLPEQAEAGPIQVFSSETNPSPK